MSSREIERIPTATIERLSLYLRFLSQLEASGRYTTSSAELGAAVGLTGAQARRDLSYFGQFGRSGYGYDVTSLLARIKRILGTDRQWRVAVVGVGNLGRALLTYAGFKKQGFEIVALFDNDPRKVGRSYEGIKVSPMSQLGRKVRSLGIEIGIIAVPAGAAQEVANALVKAGLKGILNFAPATIHVPDDVVLRSVDLAIQLEQISYHINQIGRSKSRR